MGELRRRESMSMGEQSSRMERLDDEPVLLLWPMKEVESGPSKMGAGGPCPPVQVAINIGATHDSNLPVAVSGRQWQSVAVNRRPSEG